MLRPEVRSCLFQKCCSAVMRVMKKILLLHHHVDRWCTSGLSPHLNNECCWEQKGEEENDQVPASVQHLCIVSKVGPTQRGMLTPVTRWKASTFTLAFAEEGSNVVCSIWFGGWVSPGLDDIFQLMPCNYISDDVQGPQVVTSLFLGI